jgi:hypothetical protein
MLRFSVRIWPIPGVRFHKADFQADYIKAALSLACSAISGWKAVLSVVCPYAALAVSFAAFVVWNGGVVLGKLIYMNMRF